MIWHCPAKEDVIAIFKEANMPLCEDDVSALEEVVADLEKDGLSRRFVIMDAQCRICNYKELAIVPEVVDLDNLQCFNCESMAVQEREVPEWEQE